MEIEHQLNVLPTNINNNLSNNLSHNGLPNLVNDSINHQNGNKYLNQNNLSEDREEKKKIIQNY